MLLTKETGEKLYTAHSWLAVALISAIPVLCIPAPRVLGVFPAIAGGLGLLLFLTSPGKNPWLPLWLCLATLLAWLGITTFFINEHPEIAAGFAQTRFLKLAGGVLGGFGLVAAARRLPRKQQMFLKKALPCAVGLGAALLLIEYFFDHPLYRVLRGISFADEVRDSEINRGMVTLAIMMWPALALLASEKKTGALLLFAAFVTAALLLCQSSQSAQLGILAGALGFAGAKLKPKPFLPAAAVAICLGLAATPWIAAKLYETKPAILWNWKAAAAQQRLSLWNAVATQAMEKPAAGHGIEATRILSPQIKKHLNKKFRKRWREIWHPHNGALQIWVEAGFTGVLLAAAFLWAVLMRIKRMPEKIVPYAFASFTAATAIALVGYGLWQGWWIGLLFTTGAAFSYAARSAEASSPSSAMAPSAFRAFLTFMKSR